MAYAIGLGLAVVVCVWAALVGFDRERVFYPTVLVVVAHYYVLFAAVGGSLATVAVEAVFMAGFVVLAVVGFRGTLWVAAAAMAGHGVFDAFHGFIVSNPGMPPSWPAFCLAFDVAAAGAMAWLLRRRPALARSV